MSILKAEIGKFDGTMASVVFNEGDKISSLLTKANLEVGSGELLNNDDGEVVQVSDEAEEGRTYYIVGNFKQGNKK